MTQDLHNEVTQDLHKQVTQDLHNEVTQDLHKQVTQDLHNELTQDLHNEVMQDLHKHVTQDLVTWWSKCCWPMPGLQVRHVTKPQINVSLQAVIGAGPVGPFLLTRQPLAICLNIYSPYLLPDRQPPD